MNVASARADTLPLYPSPPVTSPQTARFSDESLIEKKGTRQDEAVKRDSILAAMASLKCCPIFKGLSEDQLSRQCVVMDSCINLSIIGTMQVEL